MCFMNSISLIESEVTNYFDFFKFNLRLKFTERKEKSIKINMLK